MENETVTIEVLLASGLEVDDEDIVIVVLSVVEPKTVPDRAAESVESALVV